jgi:hypothetical protein
MVRDGFVHGGMKARLVRNRKPLPDRQTREKESTKATAMLSAIINTCGRIVGSLPVILFTRVNWST